LTQALMMAAAGALGALARYGVGLLVMRVFSTRFPLGTLIVNIFGCLLIGLVLQMAAGNELISRTARLTIVVGFLGAFTTFSAFGYETFRHLELGSWGMALGNVAANVILGLGAVWLGMVTGRHFFPTS